MEGSIVTVDRIRRLARFKGLSITQLEGALNFGNGTIGKWRESTPTVDKLVKVANYFGVSVDSLVGRSAWVMETKNTAPQEKETKCAKVIQVIEVRTAVGRGTEKDPNRIVTEYWSLDGKLLAVNDPEGKE